jgi:hypothetical protein
VPDPLCIVVQRHRHRHTHTDTHRHTDTHPHVQCIHRRLRQNVLDLLELLYHPLIHFFVFFIHPSFIFPTRAAAAHILNGCLMKRLLVSIVVSWFVSPSNIGSR